MSTIIIQIVGSQKSEYSIDECRPMQNWFDLPDDSPFYTWVFASQIIFFYVVVVGTAFCMDALVSQILALDEHVSLIRNLLHFVSTQPVLWVYCLVEYRAIFKIAIYGKSVCGHKASDKSALAGPKAQGEPVKD